MSGKNLQTIFGSEIEIKMTASVSKYGNVSMIKALLS